MQSHKNPEFYKDYSSAEIHQFETILQLVHSPEPNVALAKQMVEDFSDNRQLQRFKDFKKSFEATLTLSQKNLDQHEKSLAALKQHENKIHSTNRALVHSQVQHTSVDVKNRKTSPLGDVTENHAHKKHKR